jgi:CheY-like chemotaxis protein
MRNRRGVLVIEDEDILAAELQSLLETEGCLVTGVAADTAEALTLADEVKPDWAIVDLHLRDGLTGAQIGRRLAKDYAVPVLYVTSDIIAAPLDHPGIIGMFPKIFYGTDFRDVVKFVDAYLEGYRTVPPKFLIVPP